MAPDPNQGGRVVMYGGLDLSASKIYDDMWVYNPVINGVGYGWTQINPVLGTPTPPPPVYAHAMATDDSTGLVVMTCDPSPYNHGETWEWNGVSWNFRNFGGMGSPDYRSDQAMAYHPMNQSLGGGGVMIFGGRPWANGSNPWGWLSSAATWTKLSPLPPPNLDRDGTAMVYDSSCRNKIVVYGGADAGGYANDEIWLWDDAPAGGTWTQVAATPNNPGYRYLHAMAYDELSDRIVMFGGSKSSGQCGGVDNETWVASPCKHDYNRDWVSDGFDDLAFYNDVVNGVKLPLCWDLNGDGVVDVFDVAVFPGLPCY